MNYPKNIILFILIIWFCSCSINGSFQGLYSYYDKTKSYNPDLLVKPSAVNPLCQLKQGSPPRILVVDGVSLKTCINTAEKAVVYIWSPKCKSKNCYPLDLLQQKTNTRNINLFIVAEYYDGELMSLNYKINRPIYGIDIDYYNSNLTSKYLPLFLKDLAASNVPKTRFLYFENGELKRTFDEIGEL